MNFFLTSILLILLLINPVMAHIFFDIDSMKSSQMHAKSYHSSLYAGKIVVTDETGTDWLDYASAVPLGKPGEKQTKTILSCAHTYIESLDYSSRLFYCDWDDRMHEIKKVLCYDNDTRVTAQNDIGLHYIDTPIICNPFTEISQDLTPQVTLSTVSFGWSLIAGQDHCEFTNYKGSTAYYAQNTFEYSQQGTYVHNYTADRVVSLFDGGKYATGFLSQIVHPNHAEPTIPFSQTYYHDSGSSWFTPNASGGYTFSAVTSRFTPVENDSDKDEDIFETLLSEDNFQGSCQDTLSILRSFKLKKERPFQNILTALSPLRDWIYRHLAAV